MYSLSVAIQLKAATIACVIALCDLNYLPQPAAPIYTMRLSVPDIEPVVVIEKDPAPVPEIRAAAFPDDRHLVWRSTPDEYG